MPKHNFIIKHKPTKIGIEISLKESPDNTITLDYDAENKTINIYPLLSPITNKTTIEEIEAYTKATEAVIKYIKQNIK